MQIRLDSAQLEGSKLILQGNYQQMLQFLDSFKAGNYNITAKKEKRSNDANAYAWVLIGKIAEKMHLDPIEVYRDQLSCVAEIDTPIKISKDALDEFTTLFIGDHIGRQVIIQDAEDESVYVICRKGSSDFDTSRMSVLIENLILDCKTLGIETEDEGYINSLLEDWK